MACRLDSVLSATLYEEQRGVGEDFRERGRRHGSSDR
jgi:hypothetical protein